MKRICLAIPTNRSCPAAILGLVQEARAALEEFALEIVVLIADTSSASALAENRSAVAAATRNTSHYASNCGPRLQVQHLDHAQQSQYLQRILHQVWGTDHERCREMLHILLPDAVSYGAATNRLFLLAAQFGCSSVHRRDSDSRYQYANGKPLYPLLRELRHLGHPAASLEVQAVAAQPLNWECPVWQVGASYLGELSIDIGDMFTRDAAAAYQIVGKFAPSWLSEAERRAWVDASYLHTANRPFQAEHDTLGHGHSCLVDTCNISFHTVQNWLPLPPACDTVGTDYFLISVLNILRLPVVHHQRHIDNFYTPERRTESGFLAYQMRLVKYYLYMSWLHAAIARIDQAREHIIRPCTEAGLGAEPLAPGLVWYPARLWPCLAPQAEALHQENRAKLEHLQNLFQSLGAPYSALAQQIQREQQALLNTCLADIHQHCRLMSHWPQLMQAAHHLSEEMELRHAC